METERKKRRGLRYAFGGPIVRQDAPRLAEQDNPNSPEFVPLEERGEMGKARFWALMKDKRKRQQVAGVFDG